MSNQSGSGGSGGCSPMTLFALGILMMLLIIALFGSCSSKPDWQHQSQTIVAAFSTGLAELAGQEKPLSANITTTITIRTPTVQAALPAASCVPAPTLSDPFAGQPAAATSLTLAWKTDYALRPSEMFDVLASPKHGRLERAAGHQSARDHRQDNRKIGSD